MQEIEIKLCKKCNELKKRIQDGKFDGKNKRWRDEEGSLWNGRVCGRCNLDRVKNLMKQKRSASNEEQDPKIS